MRKDKWKMETPTPKSQPLTTIGQVILFGHAYRPLIVRLVFRTVVVANAKPQHLNTFRRPFATTALPTARTAMLAKELRSQSPK